MRPGGDCRCHLTSTGLANCGGSGPQKLTRGSCAHGRGSSHLWQWGFLGHIGVTTRCPASVPCSCWKGEELMLGNVRPWASGRAERLMSSALRPQGAAAAPSVQLLSPGTHREGQGCSPERPAGCATFCSPSVPPCDPHVASGEAETNPQICALGTFQLAATSKGAAGLRGLWMLLLKGHATFNSKQILGAAV